MAQSKYNSRKTLKIIRNLPVDVTTNDQIATVLGIHRSTLGAWMRRHRAFKAVMHAHKDRADQAMENALFKRGMGYDYEESKIVDGVTTTFKRHAVPDVRAQEFWLRNRKKADWQAMPDPPSSADGEAETIRSPLAGPPRSPMKKDKKETKDDGKATE